MINFGRESVCQRDISLQIKIIEFSRYIIDHSALTSCFAIMWNYEHLQDTSFIHHISEMERDKFVVCYFKQALIKAKTHEKSIVPGS